MTECVKIYKRGASQKPSSLNNKLKSPSVFILPSAHDRNRVFCFVEDSAFFNFHPARKHVEPLHPKMESLHGHHIIQHGQLVPEVRSQRSTRRPVDLSGCVLLSGHKGAVVSFSSLRPEGRSPASASVLCDVIQPAARRESKRLPFREERKETPVSSSRCGAAYVLRSDALPSSLLLPFRGGFLLAVGVVGVGRRGEGEASVPDRRAADLRSHEKKDEFLHSIIFKQVTVFTEVTAGSPASAHRSSERRPAADSLSPGRTAPRHPAPAAPPPRAGPGRSRRAWRGSGGRSEAGRGGRL